MFSWNMWSRGTDGKNNVSKDGDEVERPLREDSTKKVEGRILVKSSLDSGFSILKD